MTLNLENRGFCAIFGCRRVKCNEMDGDKLILAANRNCHKLLCVSWALARISCFLYLQRGSNICLQNVSNSASGQIWHSLKLQPNPSVSFAVIFQTTFLPYLVKNLKIHSWMRKTIQMTTKILHTPARATFYLPGQFQPNPPVALSIILLGNQRINK